MYFLLWKTHIYDYHFNKERDALNIGRSSWEGARANTLLLATTVTLISGQKVVAEPSLGWRTWLSPCT